MLEPLAPNVVHELVKFSCLDTLVEVVVDLLDLLWREEWYY